MKAKIQIFGFGEAPRAAALGYVMREVIVGTADQISERFEGDLIAVTGAAVHGQPGAFEFAIFTKGDFKRARAFGQQHELLRAAVLAQIAYWEALKRLEVALTDRKGFSDRANDDVIDAISDPAAAGPTDPYGTITDEQLLRVIKIVEQYPLED